MKQILLLAALALLGGCASEAKYKANMDTWVGQDEAKMIRKWGPPESVYESGGSKFLQYSFSNTLVLPGTPTTANTTYNGNAAFTTVNHGAPAQGIEYACATVVEVKDAKIVGWSSRGNGCVAE
ncbi:hypothetical protein [Pseudomonas sp. JAI120]|uniref:hypothetical protein n=1 Tax=Pseudomonas sp. JAI120 TaxID=2723063 RepID=UPI0030D9CE05